MDLPPGLSVCPTCHDVTGVVNDPASRYHRVRSRCLCEGVRCKWCGQMSRRPISDHYVPQLGHFLHTPYFHAPWLHEAGCAKRDLTADPPLTAAERARLDREWEAALRRGAKMKGGTSIRIGPPSGWVREPNTDSEA